MQHSSFIDIEIDVRVEVLAIQVLMRTTAIQGLISKQIGNSGEIRHDLEERFRIDVLIKFRIKRADRTDIFCHRFATDVAELVLRLFLIEARKVSNQSFANLGLKEVVDLDVAEGKCALKSVPDISGVSDSLLVNHCKNLIKAVDFEVNFEDVSFKQCSHDKDVAPTAIVDVGYFIKMLQEIRHKKRSERQASRLSELNQRSLPLADHL